METAETVDNYILLKMIGKFSLGEIYFSKKKGSEEKFAIKKIGRNYIDKQGLSKIIDKEIELSKSLSHPNICRYIGILKTIKYYYLVMEYINGFALSQCLEMYQYKHNASFSEQIVQYLMKQIIDAFKLIHSKHIIHRDINLDNIMVHFNDENDKNNLNLLKVKIKIIDFGLALNDDSDKTVLGSPLTMSPELLKSLVDPDNNKIFYDNKIDIWSLGAICYEMLTGKTVYDAQSLNDLVTKAEIGTYKFPNNLSLEAISFVYNMLRYIPNQRLSADILANHNFLTKNVIQFQRINQNEEIVLNTKEENPQLRFGNQVLNPNTPYIKTNQQQHTNQMNGLNPKPPYIITNQQQHPNQKNGLNPKTPYIITNQQQSSNQMNGLNPKEPYIIKNQQKSSNQINEKNPKTGDVIKNQQQPPNQMNEKNLKATQASVSNTLFNNPNINNNNNIQGNTNTITYPPQYSPQHTHSIYQSQYYPEMRKDPYEKDNMAIPFYNNNNLLINNQGIGSQETNKQNNPNTDCFIF